MELKKERISSSETSFFFRPFIYDCKEKINIKLFDKRNVFSFCIACMPKYIKYLLRI